jgi:DNA-binding NtrC family response regulator
VTPLGSATARNVNVRFIAATTRDLEEEASGGSFRQDLYFRLCGFSLEIPPLRQRRAEIWPLAQQFAEEAARRNERPMPQLDPSLQPLLEGYAWPGTIRELRNLMERAFLLGDDGMIRPEHLPLDKLAARFTRPRQLPGGGLSATEAQRIADALAECGGNQTRAARLLGMSLRTLVNRLDALGFPRPKKGRS